MKKKQEIRKLIKGKRREELKQAGAYDGRFSPRVETSNKKYKLEKHKDILDDED